MVKRRRRRPGNDGRGAVALDRGWSAPGGTRIRLARPDDVDEVDRLSALARVDFGSDLARGLRSGLIAGHLVTALSRNPPGDLIERLAPVMAGEEDAVEGMMKLSLVLVAEGRSGEICGVLSATPPITLMQMLGQGTPDLRLVYVSAITIAKIIAVAVDESGRGQGIGGTLLKRCSQVYLRLGYIMIYGQFRDEDGLEPFYRRHGFEVLPTGAELPVSDLLGHPIHLWPNAGERWFLRWR